MNPIWIFVLISMVLFVQGDNNSDDIPQNLLNNYTVVFLENQLVLPCDLQARLQVKAFSWYKKSTKGHWVKLNTQPSLTVDKNGMYKCRMLSNEGLVKELKFAVLSRRDKNFKAASSGQSEISQSESAVKISKTTVSKETTQSPTVPISKIVQTSTLSVTETAAGSTESPSVELDIWSYVGIGAASLIVVGGIILTFYLLYKRRLICAEREPSNFPRVEITHTERTLSRTSVDFLPGSSNRRPRGESNASSGSGEYMYKNPAANTSDSVAPTATNPSNQLSMVSTESTFRRMSSRNASKTSKHSQMSFQEPLDDSMLTDDPQFQPGKLSLLV